MKLDLNRRKQGSPGYALEESFDAFLSGRDDIDSYHWLSNHHKTVFDFSVRTLSGQFFYIDVVGWQPFRNTERLTTTHKDWSKLCDYAKEKHADGAYLAFCESPQYETWYFLKIHEDMPTSNLIISKARAKGLMKADYLFSDKRSAKAIRADIAKRAYTPRAARMNDLSDWLYGEGSIA